MEQLDWNKYHEIDFGTVLTGISYEKKFEDPAFSKIQKVELNVGCQPLENPFNVYIDEEDFYSVKIKFISDRPSRLYCCYYYVVSLDLQYVLCIKASTADLVLAVSRKTFELKTSKKGEMKSTLFELKNVSKCRAVFEFQLDDAQNDISLKPRFGKLDPGSSIKVVFTFTARNYGVFYRVIYCFVHNHPPFALEAQVACIREANVNIYQKLYFTQPVPKPSSDTYKFLFDVTLDKKDDNIKIPGAPALLDRVYIDLGSKSMSSGDASLSNRFVIQNHSPIDLRMQWNTDRTGVFQVVPRQIIMARGGKTSFEVCFNPSSKDNLYSATLDGCLGWGENGAFSVPFHLSLNLIGNSFDETCCGWLPQCKIPERIVMPPSCPNQRSWTSFIIKKSGHLPLMFRFLGPVKTHYRFLPEHGVIYDDFQIVIVQFTPGLISAVYKEKWHVLLNTSVLIEMELIGTTSNPNVWFPYSDKVIFPPTPLKCTSDAYIHVKNTTAHPIRYDIETTDDIIRPKVRGSCLYPGEEAQLWLSFNPRSLGQFNTTRYLILYCHVNQCGKICTNRHLFHITGTAILARLTSIPENLFLGNFHRDEIISNFFVVRNREDCSCYIKLKVFPKETLSAFKKFTFEPECFTLEPRRQLMINITIEADTSGYQSFEVQAIICKTSSWKPDEEVTGIHLANISFFCYSYEFRIADIVCLSENEPALSKYHLWNILNIDGWNAKMKKSCVCFTDETVESKVPENEIGSKILKMGLIFENKSTVPCTLNVVKTTPCDCPPYTTKTGYILERPDLLCPHRSQVWMAPNTENYSPKERKMLSLIIVYDNPSVSLSMFRLTLFCSTHPSVKHTINIQLTRYALRDIDPSADICHFDHCENESTISLTSVHIGTPSPPFQAVWFYNNMEDKVPYNIKLTGDDKECLECINPKGFISDYSLHPVIVKFSPLCPKEYQVTLECALGDKKRTVVIKAKGVMNHSRNPLLIDTTMPSSAYGSLYDNRTDSNISLTSQRILIDGMLTHSTAIRIVQFRNKSYRKVKFNWNPCVIDGLLSIHVEPSDGLIEYKEEVTLKVIVKSFGSPFVITSTLTCELFHKKRVRKSLMSLKQGGETSKYGTFGDLKTYSVKSVLSAFDQFSDKATESGAQSYIHLSVAVNCSSLEWLEKIPLGTKKLKASRRKSLPPVPLHQAETLLPMSRSLSFMSSQVLKFVMMDILESKRFQEELSKRTTPKYYDDLRRKTMTPIVATPSLNKETLYRILEENLFSVISNYKEK